MANAVKEPHTNNIVLYMSPREAKLLFRLLYWHVGGQGNIRVLFGGIMDTLSTALALNIQGRLSTKMLPAENDRSVLYVRDGE